MNAKIPFEIDRNRQEPLITQVADGLGRAIKTGFYRPGDILPTLDDLSAALGVSLIVVRSAIRRLVRDGLVNPRPGVGTVVLNNATRLWRGQVVIVTSELRDNYLNATLCGILRERLLQAGYLPSQVTVAKSAKGKWDLAQLDALLRHPVSLVVSFIRDKVIAVHVEKVGVRSVFVATGCNQALKDFADACVAAGIQKVMEICFTTNNRHSLPDRQLERAGLSVSRVTLEEKDGISSIERVQQATLSEFDRRLSSGTSRLPDLFYFNDDFAAGAALIALMHHQVRVPEDVGLVTWVNRGNSPCFYRELSRIELDPYEGGEALSQFVLAALGGQNVNREFTVEATFKTGATIRGASRAATPP